MKEIKTETKSRNSSFGKASKKKKVSTPVQVQQEQKMSDEYVGSLLSSLNQSFPIVSECQPLEVEANKDGQLDETMVQVGDGIMPRETTSADNENEEMKSKDGSDRSNDSQSSKISRASRYIQSVKDALASPFKTMIN